MTAQNYCTRLHRRRISRRSLLDISAHAGIGAVGLALVGCGDDDDDDGQPAAAQVEQQAAQPTQQQAQQQQA